MDTVRFGVIGLGNMGSFHAASFVDLQSARLTAVCDPKPARAAEVGTKYQAAHFARYQDLLDSGEVDAVLIATPHLQHPEICLAAFDRNVHVLSEKPIAISIGKAREVNAAAVVHPKLKFSIMFQQRTVSLYRKLREVIADGELGAITRISWLVTDWFRTWAYYASGGWRATWAGEGGGVLINQCPHNLDMLYWLTGMTPNRVTAVASIGKTHPIEVEDEVSAILEYPNGAIGHFVTTTGEAPGTNRLEICGDRGKIVAENGRLQFTRTRKGVQSIRETSREAFAQVETWVCEIPHTPGAMEGHKGITQNFINAILRDEPLIAPGMDGARALELGSAMQMAGINRTPVELPLDAGAHDRFLEEMKQKYGGKKTLATQPAVVADMGASFAKP